MAGIALAAAFTRGFTRVGSAFLAGPQTVPIVIRPVIRLTAAAGTRLVPAAGSAGM